MQIEEAYKQKLAAQLAEWSAEINLLDAKVVNAGADMRVKRAEALGELRAKQNAAHEKMKELGKASGEAWEAVKLTADKVWDDLRSGLAEANSKFK